MQGEFPIQDVLEGFVSGLPGFLTEGPDARIKNIPESGDTLSYKVRVTRNEEHASYDVTLDVEAVDRLKVRAKVTIEGCGDRASTVIEKDYDAIVRGLPSQGCVPIGFEQLPTAFGPIDCVISMYSAHGSAYIAWINDRMSYRTIYDRSGYRYYVDVTGGSLFL